MNKDKRAWNNMSPEERKRIELARDAASLCRKGWPFKDKNAAQRQALIGGFNASAAHRRFGL